jgi:hypothetical protein
VLLSIEQDGRDSVRKRGHKAKDETTTPLQYSCRSDFVCQAMGRTLVQVEANHPSRKLRLAMLFSAPPPRYEKLRESRSPQISVQSV